MNHIPDPDFEDFIRRAREASVKGLLEKRGLWKAVMNGDRGVPCPACGGQDRFAVNMRKNVFTCRKSGAGGGALALWAHLAGDTRLRGPDFIDACAEILGEDPPVRDRSGATAAESLQRAEQRRALAEMQAKQAVVDEARAAQASRAFREKERYRAWRLWCGGVAPADTAVAAMLALRGLALQGDEDLRYLANAPLWSAPTSDNPRPRLVHEGPAMLGAITGPEWVFVKNEAGATIRRRRFLGVHITWIDLADADGKLRLADPLTGELLPAKKVIGTWKGGSIHLGGAIDRDPGPAIMVAGEGIETTLSGRAFLRALGPDWPGHGVTEFRSFIALDNFAGRSDGMVTHPTEKKADSLGRMRWQKVRGPKPQWPDPWEPVPFRPATLELIWLRDGDSEPFFTDMAVQRGAARYLRHYPGMTLRIAAADVGKDFNNMWREMAA